VVRAEQIQPLPPEVVLTRPAKYPHDAGQAGRKGPHQRHPSQSPPTWGPRGLTAAGYACLLSWKEGQGAIQHWESLHPTCRANRRCGLLGVPSSAHGKPTAGHRERTETERRLRHPFPPRLEVPWRQPSSIFWSQCHKGPPFRSPPPSPLRINWHSGFGWCLAVAL